ncbi:MAG: hypothetical protein FWD57_01955 [Polyangiaceae bacterium]|nr:hypothetical protein [Polyangiaceae bacterium]
MFLDVFGSVRGVATGTDSTLPVRWLWGSVACGAETADLVSHRRRHGDVTADTARILGNLREMSECMGVGRAPKGRRNQVWRGLQGYSSTPAEKVENSSWRECQRWHSVLRYRIGDSGCRTAELPYECASSSIVGSIPVVDMAIRTAPWEHFDYPSTPFTLPVGATPAKWVNLAGYLLCLVGNSGT